MNSLYPILIYLAPFSGALLCAAVGWWYRGAARVIALASLGVMSALVVAGGASTLVAGSLHTHLGGWAPPLGIELVLDPLSALMAALVAGVSLTVLAGLGRPVKAELEGRETAFYALSLLLVAGMTGMVVTGDLFNMFVHLEVTSLSAYALTGSGRPGAARAGLNYLLIGSLGASLYLLGVGFVYAGTGTLNMADAMARLAEAPARLTGMGATLIVAGLAVKMALFPVHGWMPSAYAATTSPAATLMAALVTKVAAYALVRVLFWAFGAGHLEAMPALMETLGWAGAAAIVIGGALAFLQNDVRRLLAYSSVSQMGLIAVGVSLANRDGFAGAVLHIVNDGLMKAALFLAAAVALTRFGVRRVDELGALRGRAPGTIAIIAVAGVSLIGLPPLAGFFGKWYVLLGALEAERWAFVAAIGIGTLITAGYVFRILEPLLFAKAAEPDRGLGDDHTLAPAAGGTSTRAAVIAGTVLALALVLLGLFNAPVVTHFVRAALPEGF